MKLKNIIKIAIILILSQSAYAFEMKDVIAYPIPFNPKTNTLKVAYPAAASKIDITVFDINGDLVLKKTGTTNPFIWNGRNSSGKFVKPGLYMIKVEIENNTGDYGKKIIRILVDY